jgi:hydrogenase nickel incorporation protein HypA/HybF
MHELSIAQKIIETIEAEAQKNNIAKVTSAKLKIGKMAAFQKEQLEFCLNTYEKNESLKDMRFEINEIPVELSCRRCGMRFRDERFNDHEFAHDIAHAPALYIPPECPSCKSNDVTVISGSEMELTSIEGE